MKNLSFKKHLTEMALRDYKPIGDFSKGTSFRSKRDRMLINHPRAIELIKKKFGATDFEFDFYFVNTKEARNYSEVGEVNPQWVKDKLGDEVYNEVMKNTDDDSIKIIFTNNNGDERRPMTAWIMAHRIGHALARGDSSASHHYKEASNHLISNLGSILEYYGIQNFPSSDREMNGDRQGGFGSQNTRKNQLTMLNFFYHIATFRSAREKNIRDWFEILNELIAQYLTTGKIKFNPPPEEFKVHTRNGKALYRFNKDENMEELKHMVEGLARDMQYMIDGILHTTHNSIFVM